MADWSDEELRLLVDSYLMMLQSEQAGIPYNKAEENRRLQLRIQRSRSSIEFKHCNVSAVLANLNRPYISGYKPRPHVQLALRRYIESRITEFGASEATLGQDATHGQGQAPAPIQPPAASHTVHPEAFWDQIAHLWDRSTGGRDVASKPESQSASPDYWPKAPRPAGVEEATEWFLTGISESRMPRFLFLVGGPGAGKSDAAAEIVQGLAQVRTPAEGLAHRTYVYEWGEKQIVLVNDATISEKTAKQGALARDINEAQRSGNHLVACVNRGVLVEEIAAVRSSSQAGYQAGQVLTTWLHDHQDESLANQDWTIKNSTHHDYMAAGELHDGTAVRALICVVFTDVCSLFEVKPKVEIGPSAEGGISLHCAEYRITPMSARPQLDLSLIPAAELISEVLSLLNPTESDLGSDWNPIVANVQALTDLDVRRGLLDIFRAGEIVAGKRMTYRELWGALVRSLVGDLPDRITRGELGDYMAQNKPSQNSELQRFVAMKNLAELRLTQAVYGARNDSGDGMALRGDNPVIQVLGPVDPTRDAVPGFFDQSDSSGWSSPVVAAFTGQSESGSPLALLLASVPSTDALHSITKAFDRSLDAAFVAALAQGMTSQKRASAYSWYGRYLTRLYATANGIPAFRSDICMWTNAWTLSKTVPTPLKNRLKSLLRPNRDPRDGDSSALIPVFDSRVMPIHGASSTAKLALASTDIELVSKIEGELIFLVLLEGTIEIAQINLDFALVREAMSVGSNYAGVTEQTDRTAPRLERLRAARLIPKKLDDKNYMVLKGASEWQLKISNK